MRFPLSVVVTIFLFPLAVVLAWADILRRPDMSPPLKGLWIVLCTVPALGPLLYLGIGGGRFDLVLDRISGVFLGAALVLLVVAGVNRTRGYASHRWQGRQTSFVTQVNIPAGPIPYIVKRGWSLRYGYVCPGLHAHKGLPPNTFLRTILHLEVQGPGEGTDMSDNLGSDSHVFRFMDGGAFSIHLTIRNGCTWFVTTASA